MAAAGYAPRRATRGVGDEAEALPSSPRRYAPRDEQYDALARGFGTAASLARSVRDEGDAAGDARGGGAAAAGARPAKPPQLFDVIEADEDVWLQLVEALQRAGAAPSARAAVRQLMEGGVRPPVELMAFLNIDAPRRPGSTLYKAMFGASKKHEARLGEATPIQRWCD